MRTTKAVLVWGLCAHIAGVAPFHHPPAGPFRSHGSIARRAKPGRGGSSDPENTGPLGFTVNRAWVVVRSVSSLAVPLLTGPAIASTGETVARHPEVLSAVTQASAITLADAEGMAGLAMSAVAFGAGAVLGGLLGSPHREDAEAGVVVMGSGAAERDAGADDEERLASLRRELVEKDEQLSAMETGYWEELSALKAQYSDTDSTIEGLQGDLKAAREALADASSELAAEKVKAEGAVLEVEARLSEATTELAQYSGTDAALAKLQEDLEASQQALAGASSELAAEKTRAEAAVLELESRLTRATEELAQRSTAEEGAIARLQQQVADLEQVADELRRGMAEGEARLAEATDELAQRSADDETVARLEREVADLEQVADELRRGMAEAEAELTATTEADSSATKELEDALAGAQRVIQSLNQDVKASEGRVEAAQAALGELRVDLEAKHETALDAQARQHKEELLKVVEMVKQQIKEQIQSDVDAQVEAMRASAEQELALKVAEAEERMRVANERDESSPPPGADVGVSGEAGESVALRKEAAVEEVVDDGREDEEAEELQRQAQHLAALGRSYIRGLRVTDLRTFLGKRSIPVVDAAGANLKKPELLDVVFAFLDREGLL